MNKIINFLKKIGLLRFGSASYKGKNQTMLTPDILPNKKKENKPSQGSW